MKDIRVQWYNSEVDSYSNRTFDNWGNALEFAHHVVEVIRCPHNPYASVVVISGNSIRYL